MKKFILIPILLIIVGLINLTGSQSHAGLVGLAWDGTSLWVSDEHSTIYQVNPFSETQRIIKSYNYDGQIYNIRDLAWDGNSLWVTS